MASGFSGNHRPRSRGGASRGSSRGRGDRRPYHGGDRRPYHGGDRRPYHGGNRPGGGTIILGFNALQKLREKDPDDIVLDMASERCLPASKALLGRTDLSPDMIELVVEVLAKSFDSNSPQCFNKLLVEIPKSMFVILHLKTHITRLCAHGNYSENPQLFLERTVKLFSEILKKIPNAFDTLPLGDLDQAVAVLAASGQISGELKRDAEQLKVIKEESLEKEKRKIELEKQRQERRRNPEKGAVGPPPDDFREMTIIPEYNDIYAENEPYLRKNIVKGRYNDLEHYLDVQFRLLREDFLRPLREGITNLVSRGIDEKQGMFKEIRVYRNVKILHPECSNKGLLHEIEFEVTYKLRRIQWENSKRLIFGSLLCLSKDNFQTFVFATVSERDPLKLKHGKVTVQFIASTIDTQDFSRKNVYQMVETTAYFEAYNPILKGLQVTTENDLPFQRYLVECNKIINSPSYLEHNRFVVSAPTFDFSSILCNKDPPLTRRFQRLSLGRVPDNSTQFEAVPVVELDRWPSKEQLGLDESQYKALQTALTKEVAVIQGPPGTGKTYLGLKIAKILLSNKEKWIQGEATRIRRRRAEVKQTPILVICYTNHALDQFLEGIYDFCGNEESKIIRIGGRSKSEKLKDCNLNAIKYRNHKQIPILVRNGLYEARNKIADVENKMQRSSNVLRKCWNHIVFEKTLKQTDVADKHHFRSLVKPFEGRNLDQGSVLLRWLNLVVEQEDAVIFGEEKQAFDGTRVETCESLPFARTDFSLCTSIKSKRIGCIVCSVPENRVWEDDSKALIIDAAGLIEFISNQNILARSYSRVDDNKWHEVAVVYSDENKRLMLFVDKRVEDIRDVTIPDDNPQHGLIIGGAPKRTRVVQQNFVGAMKNFVYCQNTKYAETAMGDASENVEYEIDFIQEQRKVDDEDDRLDSRRRKRPDTVDDFGVVDSSKLITSSGGGGWEVQNKNQQKKKIGFEIRKQLQSEDVMTETEASRFQDVWSLDLKDRWRLYRKWVRDISQQHQNTIASIQGEYEEGMKEQQEWRNAQNYEHLKSAHVIGMTTTGAAKNRELLHRIKPKITIVEEAAEVLESHIVTALTEGCEHLILIGDHKQLRPKPTVFQLGLDYQLDISLFERMVENGMPFSRLGAQHRMRPEISVMMRPIYEKLSDHESVFNFEHIKGINKDIFFVNHKENEDDLDENRSRSNAHEAKFVGALCNYLLQQGYSPSQITVLTPYTGQLFQLKKFVPNVQDLRICVVDNFQGEENDIIVLSLVRSQDFATKEKKEIRRLIGFLAIDNRICVSLSRAKKGFFCIGNLSLMRAANDLWSKILDDMEQRDSVGNALPLACQNHPGTITNVSNVTDFNKAPNGGCSVPCQARLNCGHCCEQLCHPQDPKHEEYDCRKKCPKTCVRGHPCTRMCYQDCNKCMVMLSKVVPRCGHTMQMPCHQEPSTFCCTKPCPKKLDSCGHNCANKCGEECTTRCRKEVVKIWSLCGHKNKTQCHVDPETTECPRPCGDMLKCVHQCKGTCGKCRQGRLHIPCSSKCGRISFCGHACTVPCTKNCPPCDKPCPNECPHSRCRNKCGEPCVVCQEHCQWRCEHFTCTKPCGELCNRPRCNRPCRKKLEKCGHLCAGLCGESCPEKCLICDKDELTETYLGFEDEPDARFLVLDDCGDIVVVKGMDRHMEIKDKELKEGQSTSIQMIKCPKCQKAIRTSLRYGNIIKRILQDFEAVKDNIYSVDGTAQFTFLRKVEQDIASANIELEFSEEAHEIKKNIINTKALTEDQLNVFENQIQFLKFMMKLKAIIKQVKPKEESHRLRREQLRREQVRRAEQLPRAQLPREQLPHEQLPREQLRHEQLRHKQIAWRDNEEPEIRALEHEMKVLLEWVMRKRDRFSEQELEDFNDELLRAWIFFSYEALTLEVKKKHVELSDVEKTFLAYLERVLNTGKKLLEAEKESCQKFLKFIIKHNKALQVSYTIVTEEEKKIIVKAIGLTQGHWFKCPKGHIYCIGECGGANQESKCPECGSKIGGTQHRLLPGNSLAPEMDGAGHAAWSNMANNMGNWNLN